MKWNEIKDNREIEIFLDLFGNFHDSCLKELHLWTDNFVNHDLSMSMSIEYDTNVRVLFQRQYKNPSAIEMFFEGVTQFHIVPSPKGYDSIIYQAKIFLHKGLFYWSDDCSWEPENFRTNDNSWIAAKAIKWRDVSSWMGKQNRYS